MLPWSCVCLVFGVPLHCVGIVFRVCWRLRLDCVWPAFGLRLECVCTVFALCLECSCIVVRWCFLCMHGGRGRRSAPRNVAGATCWVHPTMKDSIHVRCGRESSASRLQFPPQQPAQHLMSQTAEGPAQAALSLSEEFLVAVAEGRTALSEAARWARARCQEGGADPTMVAIAHSNGTNGERMLHERVAKEPWRQVLPQPYPFAASRAVGDGAQMDTLHCLLPHEVLGSIHAAAPHVFEELFGDAADRIHFWQEMERTAREMQAGPRAVEHQRWLENHPAKWCPPARRIPLGTHGDGGQTQGGEKITAVSWGGLCRRGSTVDTRILFIVIKDSLACGDVTFHQAYQVLAWSFGAWAPFQPQTTLAAPSGLTGTQGASNWLASPLQPWGQGSTFAALGLSYAVTGSTCRQPWASNGTSSAMTRATCAAPRTWQGPTTLGTTSAIHRALKTPSWAHTTTAPRHGRPRSPCHH